MINYIVRRLFILPLVLFGLSILIFGMLMTIKTYFPATLELALWSFIPIILSR